MASQEPIAFETLGWVLANETVASFRHLENIILLYNREAEIDTLDQYYKKRRRNVKRINSTDKIGIPKPLSIFSRIKNKRG